MYKNCPNFLLLILLSSAHVGYVFITDSGSVSAVVSGGSNADGWKLWNRMWREGVKEDDLNDLLEHAKCILLQREVPEYVNLLIATEAKRRGGILVFQDVVGKIAP